MGLETPAPPAAHDEVVGVGRPSVAAERRRQIVWALYECLTVGGHDEVTIKTIAHQADLSPGIIHHYFTSKDEIYGHLAGEMLHHYESTLDAHHAASVQGDRHQVILDFVVDELILDRPVNRVFHNLIHLCLESEVVREPIQTLLRRYRERLEIEFRPYSILGASAVAQIEGLSLQYLVDPTQFNRHDLVRLVTSFLGPRKEEA